MSKLSTIQANLEKQAKLFPGLTLSEIQEIVDKEISLVDIQKDIKNRPKEKCITSFEKLLIKTIEDGDERTDN